MESITYGDFVSDLINVWGFTETQATKIANCLDFTTLYLCTIDYQNGDFGVGRKQTEPEWFITALEWNNGCYEDDDYAMFLQYAQDHKLIDFIQDFWEIKIVKLGFKDCEEYWKQVVKDYASCLDREVNLNEDQIEIIAKSLLNDETMWECIDSTVNYYINEMRKEEK